MKIIKLERDRMMNRGLSQHPELEAINKERVEQFVSILREEGLDAIFSKVGVCGFPDEILVCDNEEKQHMGFIRRNITVTQIPYNVMQTYIDDLSKI